MWVESIVCNISVVFLRHSVAFRLSSNSVAMVDTDSNVDYCLLVWSTVWRPAGTVLHSSGEPVLLLQWQFRDDSSINAVMFVTVITIIYGGPGTLLHRCNTHTHTHLFLFNQYIFWSYSVLGRYPKVICFGAAFYRLVIQYLSKWKKWMAEIMCSVSVVLSVCLCFCLCVCSGTVNQTSLKWALNANSSTAVKATDFKFDVLACFKGQSRHDPLKILLKGGICKNHLAEICTLTSAS